MLDGFREQGWDPDSVPTLSHDPADPASPGPFSQDFSTRPPTARPLLSTAALPRPTLRSGTEGSEEGAPGDIRVNPGTRTVHRSPSSPPAQSSITIPSLDIQTSPETDDTIFARIADRETILAYAYHLYESFDGRTAGLTPAPLSSPSQEPPTLETVYTMRLLPLLLTLRSMFPRDLSVLLLLACVYHTLGQYEASITTSQEILSIDPTSVEAMCNIGTTFKCLNQLENAYEWWWKALLLRPTYWDALDNILGMLFKLARGAPDGNSSFAYYSQALAICQHIQRQIVSDDGRLRFSVSVTEMHRLQRVFFTSATIYMLLSPDHFQNALTDYFRAIELAIRPPSPYPEEENYTVQDLVLTMCIAGYLTAASAGAPIPPEISECLEVDGGASLLDRVKDPGFNLFRAVRASSSRVRDALLHIGRGALPVIFILPDQVMRIPMVLFSSSMGVLPAICSRDVPSGRLTLPTEKVRQQTNLMMSTVLLTIAKKFQDPSFANMMVPEFGGAVGISTTFVIVLYYLALALSPSPSTYNNLGIMLSIISATTTPFIDHGRQVLLNGPTMAKIYYEAGLQLDSLHPHLLTNLGSLLKDLGQIDQAIQLYMKAITVKPDFDVALANLGNAIKDVGRAWDAIEYYRRASEINPNLPEALCGLVNSLCAVCDWRGRGGFPDELAVDVEGNMLQPTGSGGSITPGWITKMIEMCQRQLDSSYSQNVGAIEGMMPPEQWIAVVARVRGRDLHAPEYSRWMAGFLRFHGKHDHMKERLNEAGFLVRFIDWVQPRLQRQWYVKVYGKTVSADHLVPFPPDDLKDSYLRPAIPTHLVAPPVPSVLPFHAFTYPMSPRMTRLIAHRNALRISYVALTQPWLPHHVFRPPRPPIQGKLNIGYISNDVNNHPLAHLMQSVFKMHDRDRFNVYLYSTSPWDGTDYRPRISTYVEHFEDISTWSLQEIIEHILKKEIHILVNLGGYTKGARNDIFAPRPCPVQIQLMGYAGTLGTGWCDYLVCDPVACPRDMCASERWRRESDKAKNQMHLDQDAGNEGVALDLEADADPESVSEDWVYSEKFIYMPHTFMVADHKQSSRQDENLTVEERACTPVAKLWYDEEVRRADCRRRLFPEMPQDVVIFANFNQLYKIDPGIFAVWLRILVQVPRSVLWLLRFPAAGEEHIKCTARMWANEEVASRILFTDVTRKEEHVYRTRVADLFLDTVECNAHTIAADVLWTGTPIITFPKHRHKMCSRVAASMAHATGFGDQMVASSMDDYETRAVAFARGLRYEIVRGADGTLLPRGQGALIKLRRNLFLNRDRMPLFDTERWTRNLEKAYQEAWRRWAEGTQFEMSDEWAATQGPEKEDGSIIVRDDDPIDVVEYD
ncbi:glycosyltransferase family 41 protein [Gelatoporia subvermispora B]|uniref:protein O-GlcNAc transferase n=1 Tax=Ceriporiopsis subvermispora (strain B) TaxID=914234 RepID=M2RSZ4_CERS8|nr:glycosyltransferase family 41 protein [Gelatoporia subvermispora B]